MQISQKILSILCVIMLTITSFVIINPRSHGIIVSVNDDSPSFENQSSLTFNFSFTQPSYDTVDINSSEGNFTFCSVTMTGSSSISYPGQPILPVDSRKILIPFGKEIDSIQVIEKAQAESYNPSDLVEPGSMPMILSDNGLPGGNFIYDPLSPLGYDEQYQMYVGCQCEDCGIIFDSDVYGSDSFFPVEDFEEVFIQKIRGFEVLDLNLHPIKYNPEDKLGIGPGGGIVPLIPGEGGMPPGEGSSGGIIHFHNYIKIKIILKDAINPSLENFRGLDSDIDIITDLVDNPGDIYSYFSGDDLGGDDSDEGNGVLSGLSSGFDTGIYTYVIITNNNLKNYNSQFNFQTLLDHRFNRGLEGCIVTVEDIYNEFTGLDNPEKIRNFIKYAYNSWNTEYVLIGGDDNIVPVKKYNIYTGGHGDVPSDLYYACLDGGGPGGVGDDLRADVYLGRAPVGNGEEISNFVKKTISYEITSSHEDNYLNKALWMGEYLFGPWRDSCGSHTWGADYKNEMIEGSNANGYPTVGIPTDGEFAFEVDTLYDKDWQENNWPQPYPGGWSKNIAINKINDGVHIINHLGHGNWYYGFKMDKSYVYDFTNTEYFFAYSQACLSGRFTENDCFAEYLTVKTDTAAFAVIMNTNVGLGDCGGTNGASQHFDREFWNAIFGSAEAETIGKAHFLSKENNLPRINQNGIRLVYYESTLFGDPAVSMKRTPGEQIGIEIDNFPPTEPELVDPLDGITGLSPEYQGRPVQIGVKVYDLNRDRMDVLFYNAEDHNLIWADYGVESGQIASVPWWGLEYGKTYSWYVVVDDSNYQPAGRNGSEFTNTSDIFSFSTIQDPSLPADSWWNADWSSRKPIFIANNGNQAEDYCFEVEIEYDTLMQDDYDDLRFVKYDDDSTELNYWIEELNNESAIFHVDLVDCYVPDSTPRACVWIYYGNDIVGNCSNFDWFKNEGGLTLDWSVVAPSPRSHNQRSYSSGLATYPVKVETDSEGNIIIGAYREYEYTVIGGRYRTGGLYPKSWLVIKLDPNGELLWETELGETWMKRKINLFDYERTGINTELKDMVVDNNDNIFVVGGGLPMIFKISPTGRIIWYTGAGGVATNTLPLWDPDEDPGVGSCRKTEHYQTKCAAVDSYGNIVVAGDGWSDIVGRTYGFISAYTSDGLCLTPSIIAQNGFAHYNYDWTYLFPNGDARTPVYRNSESEAPGDDYQIYDDIFYFEPDLTGEIFVDHSEIPANSNLKYGFIKPTYYADSTLPCNFDTINDIEFDSDENLIVTGVFDYKRYDVPGYYWRYEDEDAFIVKLRDPKEAGVKLLSAAMPYTNYLDDNPDIYDNPSNFIEFFDGYYYNISDNGSSEDLFFSKPVFYIKNDGLLPLNDVEFKISPLNFNGNTIFDTISDVKLCASYLAKVNSTYFEFNEIVTSNFSDDDSAEFSQTFYSDNYFEGTIGKIEPGEQIGIGFSTNLSYYLINSILNFYNTEGIPFNVDPLELKEEFPWYGGLHDLSTGEVTLGIKIADIEVKAPSKKGILKVSQISPIYTITENNSYLRLLPGPDGDGVVEIDPIDDSPYFPHWMNYTNTGLSRIMFRQSIDPAGSDDWPYPFRGMNDDRLRTQSLYDFVFDDEGNIIANYNGGLANFTSNGVLNSYVLENQKPLALIDQTGDMYNYGPGDPFCPDGDAKIFIPTLGGGVFNLTAYDSYDPDGEIIQYRWYKGIITEVENWPPGRYAIEDLIGVGPELIYSSCFAEGFDGHQGNNDDGYDYIRLEVMDNNGELDYEGSLKQRAPFTYAAIKGGKNSELRNKIIGFDFISGVYDPTNGEHIDYTRTHNPPEIFINNLNRDGGDISNPGKGSGAGLTGIDNYIMVNDTVFLKGIFDDPTPHLGVFNFAEHLLEAVWTIERVDVDSNRNTGFNGQSTNPISEYNITGNESQVIYYDEDKLCIRIITPVNEDISTVNVNFSEKGMYDIGLNYRWMELPEESYDPLFPYFISSRFLNITTLIVDEPGPTAPIANPGSIYADMFGNRFEDYRSVLGINMTFDGYYHGDSYDPDSDGYIVPPMVWEFGDGKGEEWRPMPKHEYELAGDYIVNQTVRDNSGLTNSTSVKVDVSRWVGGGWLALPGEEAYSGGKLRRASDGSMYIMTNWKIAEIDSNFNVVDACVDQVFNDFSRYKNHDMTVQTDGIFKNVYAVGFRGGPYWSNEWEDGGLYLAKYNYFNLEDEYIKLFIGNIEYTQTGTTTQPVLRLSSSSFDFGDISQDNSDSSSFEIWNAGASTLTYTLSESSSWLSINPDSGESTGEHDVISIDIDTSGLFVGQHSCVISVSSSDVSDSFTVYVNVIEGNPSPELSFNPGSFDFGWILVNRTDSTSISVWNGGTGVLDYTLFESCDWISLSSGSGSSSGEVDSIDVMVNTTGLSDGLHTYDIDISSPNGTGVFTVSLTVVSGPIISVSSDGFDFGDISQDNSDSSSFEIWNVGEDILEYTLSCDAAWLVVDPLVGSCSSEVDTISISVDSNGLAPGVYSHVVVINSAGGNTTFTVSMTVVEAEKEIKISKPLINTLYFRDIKLMNLKKFNGMALILGPITIEVEPVGYEPSYVKFYVDDELVNNCSENPFSYKFVDRLFGRSTIKVIAYDDSDVEICRNEIDILIFSRGAK